jgi:hypothetical protein
MHVLEPSKAIRRLDGEYGRVSYAQAYAETVNGPMTRVCIYMISRFYFLPT